jgi:hypothetical protein
MWVQSLSRLLLTPISLHLYFRYKLSTWQFSHRPWIICQK